MFGHNLPVERLREYLLALKPEALALLVTELERGLLRGDDIPGAELVLNELRRTLRETGQRVPRVGNPARLFYRPLEPFLVDDAPERRHRARVARKALTPVWQWLCNFAMKTEAESYIDLVEHALIAGDDATAASLAREFQDRAGPRMLEVLQQVKGDDRARRRLVLQIGTPHALDDVRTIGEVLSARDRLAALAAQLPGHIKTLAGPTLDSARAVLDAALARHPEIFPYGLVLVMSRLAAPWQLIRLAVAAAGSDAAARVAETPYALCADIVLTEIERLVAELTADLRSGRGVAVSALLKDVHDAMRGFRTEIDLSADVPWAGRHAAILTQISEALTAVIELIPGRVRRLLRPTAGVTVGGVLNAEDVVETEALVAFVTACRHYAGELAVNEVTLRTFSELQQYLDTGTHALLDALRSASPVERGFRQSQVDAAVRFCAQLFGKEYAALLAKAAEVAAQDTERKAAKA
ncbi:MAG TPA: hypothetical protein VNK48_03145 [Xanthobacteraceae bacterium]|nr:hypothetical protein [Xanthobacteraceae bacterium]